MLKEKLLDWMPEYYRGDHVKNIQRARDETLAEYEADQERIYGDMYASQALDIDLWEREYGITPSSPNIDERRKNLIAYIRGMVGATTKEKVEMVASSYVGNRGVVSVTEYPDLFIVDVACTYDIEEDINVSDLEKTLMAILQAHVKAVITREINNSANANLYFAIADSGTYRIDPMIMT